LVCFHAQAGRRIKKLTAGSDPGEQVPYDEFWRDLWSVGIYQLHLSEDAFWSMTPRQYGALREQHKVRVRHEELLTAIIATSVVNTSMVAPEKPAPFTAFMPSEWAKAQAKKPRKKRVSKAEHAFINSKIRSFMLARETKEP
jgi:hypothetical protein